MRPEQSEIGSRPQDQTRPVNLAKRLPVGNQPHFLAQTSLLFFQSVLTITKWFTILTLNLLIMNKVARRHAPKHLDSQLIPLRSAGSNSCTMQEKTYSDNIRILLGCALLYTVTQFPTVISNILLLLSEEPVCWYDYKLEQQMLVKPITNIFLLCNYTFNFVVYCVASAKFRQQFVGGANRFKRYQKSLHSMRSNSTLVVRYRHSLPNEEAKVDLSGGLTRTSNSSSCS